MERGDKVQLINDYQRVYGLCYGVIEGVERCGHHSMTPGWTQEVYTIRKLKRNEYTDELERTGVMIYMVPECDVVALAAVKQGKEWAR